MEPLDDLDLPTPEGHLHAFMDGELDIQAEQPLFDELASNPALRGEMRDILAIRSAVHRDVVAPPATVEAALLAAAGLSTASAGAATTAAAATIAAHGSSSLAVSLRYALGGVAAGAAIVYFLMSGTTGDVQRGAVLPPPQASTGIAGEPRIDTLRVEVPIVDHAAINAQRNQLARERANIAQAWTDLRAAQDAFLRDRDAAAQESRTPVEPVVATAQTQMAILTMQASVIQPAQVTAFPTRSFEVSDPLPLQIRFRTLASGLRSDEAIPASVRDAALPNTALSISLPLSEEHRVGVEFGREAFRQQFRTTLNGRPVEYLQTPTLFWFGANYQFVAQSIFGLDGLRPFIESTIGYALEQGPLARAAAGLQYRPIGPIAFSLGFDASALTFKHDGLWQSTTKSGFTTGISIDIGSWP